MDRDSAGRTKHHSIAIQTLFRQAIKAVTRRDDDEPPPPRRRRGDTDKAFTMTARVVLRRAFRIPEDAYVAVTDFLYGTLNYMNALPNNNNVFGDLDVEHDNADKNYPSLHL